MFAFLDFPRVGGVRVIGGLWYCGEGEDTPLYPRSAP